MSVSPVMLDQQIYWVPVSRWERHLTEHADETESVDYRDSVGSVMAEVSHWIKGVRGDSE